MSGAFPRQRLSSNSGAPPIKTALLEDHLNHLSSIAGNLEHQQAAYQEALHRIEATSPSIDASLREIDGLRAKFNNHQQWHDGQINRLKAQVQVGHDKDILARIGVDLPQQVEDEIKRQTKEVLDTQLHNLIPTGPESRVEDAQNQLRAMESLLHNSKSRMTNSYLQREDLDDPLQPVFDKNGVTSDMYPKDLRTLLAYNQDQLKKLLGHYELLVDDNWVGNINRFLTHIGVNFHLSAVRLN
ncbi:hypothetical protein AX16_003984 [Volvariella volvacea WC 439]|nr:hypothetical protein AX16_003984 [Volvariella volvacea WC 439]